MLRRHGPDSPVAWGLGPTGGGRTTTAQMMRAHVDGVAELLPRAKPGESLLVMCRDRYRFAVALLAAWQRGFSVALPPNPQLETIRTIRGQPGLVTVIHDVDGIDKGIDVRDAKVVQAARDKEGTVPFTMMPEMSPDRLLATVYTSGTTGDHAACPKTAGQLLGEARALARTFPPPDAARFVPMVPPHHIYGLLFGVLVPLVSGASFHRHTPLHAEEAAAVLRGGADVLITVPAHLKGLLLVRSDELPHVDRVFSSAAPLPPRVGQQVKDRFGWTITEVFGSSETGGIGWRDTGGQGPWTPLEGVTVRPGPDERMLLDSPFLHPDVERPYVGADRVRSVEGGRFEHLGRADGVFKIGGVRVSLAEVERRLSAIDGVRDAAALAQEVGGVRNVEIWVAVAGDGLDPRAIRAELRAWLAPVAMPRRLVVTDALPRTEQGKLPRAALEGLFAASTRAREGEDA